MLGEIYNQLKLGECSFWAQSPTTSPEKDKGSGMFCSQCGTEAQATAKFCQKCGTPFTKHFLPTQPSEVAVEKAHAPKNHAATEAVPPAQQAQHPERTTSINLGAFLVYALLIAMFIVGFGVLGAIGACCFYFYAISKKYKTSSALVAAIGAGLVISFGQGYILEKTKILSAKNSEANVAQQQAGENTAPKPLTDEEMGISSSPNAVHQQPNFFDDPKDDGSPNYTPRPAAAP